MVVLAGWSARLGRCVARAFASGDGFRSAEMLRDHGFSPTPVFQGPDHPELARLSALAASGREVGAFHLALARNQARACRAGAYGGGLGIGGEVWLAEVSADRATLRTIGEA